MKSTILFKTQLLLSLLHFLSTFGYGQWSTDSLKIIDYHVHIFSEELMRNLNEQGYDMANSGFQILSDDFTMYKNIDSISRYNTASKMLLISTGYSYKDLTDNSEVKELLVVQQENDLLSSLIYSDRNKFIGFAGINPLKSYAVQEIIRCDDELGLDGVKLHLQSCNINLEDSIHLEKLLKVIKCCSERQLPLLIHNNAWNLYYGKEYARIFFTSILENVDPVTIIFAHTGGGGLYYSFTHDFLSAYSEQLMNHEMIQRHNIYFELSGTVSTTDSPRERAMPELEQLMSAIGAHRFLFGSDYPYRNSTAYIKELETRLNLSKSTLRQIIENDIFDNLKNR